MTSRSGVPGAACRPQLGLVLVAAALALAGCREGGQSGATSLPAASRPKPRSLLDAPEPVRFAPRVTATGTLKPALSAMLSPAIPGTVERLFVSRAQEVNEGTVLMTLDSASARATLAQAQAGVKAAEATDRIAQDALDRMTAIKKAEGGVTDAQLAQVQGQRDQAAAALLAARAQLQQAEVHLRNHTLRAPFPGIVARLPDGVGMVVGPGAPLFSLQSSRALVLETSLTQAEAAEVKPGDRVTVVVPATGARTEDAQVKAVVPMVDPGTGRVPVEVAVPNADGRFLAYAFARLEVAGRAERDALKVHSTALVQKEGAYSIWIVGPEGTAQPQPVTVLGQQGDRSVVVPAGALPAGARVVAEPPPSLAEGAPFDGAAR